VLGPVLFIMYVNDMPEVVHSTLLMFADDAKIFQRIDSLENSAQIQEDLNKLAEWADIWQLGFNVSKCKVMHIGSKNQEGKYYLPVNGLEIELEETNEEKDLGVTVDKKLTFANHVEKKVNVANRILGLIRVSYSYLDVPTLRELFKSLVRPHLEYANSVWSPMYLKESHLIESVLQRTARLLPVYRVCSTGEQGAT
jgi:ribonuclease P/MRP protein subunit RPP40